MQYGERCSKTWVAAEFDLLLTTTVSSLYVWLGSSDTDVPMIVRSQAVKGSYKEVPLMLQIIREPNCLGPRFSGAAERARGTGCC